jgi:hypothetical protein
MGRPTLYKKEYNDTVYKLCLLGATDTEIADFIGIEESTLNLWKNKHQDFMESIKRGKLIADANVADKLYQRATGYEHEDLYITQFQGEIIKEPIIKHYPPDTGAAALWLKNRRMNDWKDRHEVVNTNNTTITLDATERAARIAELQRKARISAGSEVIEGEVIEG